MLPKVDYCEVAALVAALAQQMDALHISCLMLVNDGRTGTCTNSAPLVVRVNAEYERYLTPPPAFFAEHWPPQF